MILFNSVTQRFFGTNNETVWLAFSRRSQFILGALFLVVIFHSATGLANAPAPVVFQGKAQGTMTENTLYFLDEPVHNVDGKSCEIKLISTNGFFDHTMLVWEVLNSSPIRSSLSPRLALPNLNSTPGTFPMIETFHHQIALPSGATRTWKTDAGLHSFTAFDKFQGKKIFHNVWMQLHSGSTSSVMKYRSQILVERGFWGKRSIFADATCSVQYKSFKESSEKDAGIKSRSNRTEIFVAP